MVGDRAVVYLDASALVKLVRSEPESPALRASLAGSAIRLTSRIAEVELTRAVRRVPRPGDEDQVRLVLSGVQYIELEAAIAAAAGALGPPTLRSLDAIHLASALAIGDELDVLISYDVRLVDAARAAGLAVGAPA